MTDVISFRLGTFKLAWNRTQLDTQHNLREQVSDTYIQLQKAFKSYGSPNCKKIRNQPLITLIMNMATGFIGELRTCLLTAAFISSTAAFLLL